MFPAALVAFVGAAVTLVSVIALARMWAESRRMCLVAWAGTQVCLSAALGSLCLQFVLGFSPGLFRVYEVSAALLGLLWLALGLVELLARHVPVAFAARLLVISLSIVGGVILVLDPLRRPDAGNALPPVGDLYLGLPLTLVAVAHGLVMLTLVVGVGVAAVRAWRGDERGTPAFLASLLVLLAGTLVVLTVRWSLASLSPLAAASLVTAAALSLWMASPRAAQLGGSTSGRRRRGTPAPVEERSPARPTPRPDPYGLIVIFTLREGGARPFDVIAERTVEAIRAEEPGTLVFACHTVANAPQQRIFYQLYRDRAAYEEHERQPYVRRFAIERDQYVLATNVVRLKLNALMGVDDEDPAYDDGPRTGAM